MARKKLTDAQKQFIAGDDIDAEAPQQVNAGAFRTARFAGKVSEGDDGAFAPSSHGDSALPNAEANTQVSTEISDRIGANLKQELFGGRKSKESSIRFTVDIPESLNKRLAQLSVDTGKPKTELVRTIIDRALSSLDY